MFNSMFAGPSPQRLLSGEGRGIVFDSLQKGRKDEPSFIHVKNLA